VVRLAYRIARVVWWGMLWFMRRRAIRRMRTKSWAMWPEPIRGRIKRSMLAQDKWALRHGLRIVTAITAFTLGCMIMWLIFTLCQFLLDNGVFTIPESVRDRSELF
jgi:hypothetical protein